MRWNEQRQSDNVEDRRGQRAGFGGGRIGGMGIGGLLILMLFGYLIGGDPMALLRDSGQVSTGVDSGPGAGAPPRRRPTRPASSCAPCWAAPKTSGTRYSSKAAAITPSRG